MIGPNLICINVQPYATTQASERGGFWNGGGSVTPFGAVAVFPGDEAARFVAEVGAVEL